MNSWIAGSFADQKNDQRDDGNNDDDAHRDPCLKYISCNGASAEKKHSAKDEYWKK